MPDRQYSAGTGYRYGFNGKENDNEVKGEGNQQDYGMRIYDPRLGKFLSVDPLAQSFPWNSPYSFAEGDVMRSIDLDGAEKQIVTIKLFYDHNKVVVSTYKSVENGNNKFSLGNGTMYRFVISPETEISNRSGNAIMFAGKRADIYLDFSIGGLFKDWINKFDAGIVVFGSGSGKDAIMGGEVGGKKKVLATIDLNDEDTKAIFEMIDLIGKDYSQHIDIDEMAEKLPELIKGYSDVILDANDKKDGIGNTNKETKEITLPAGSDSCTVCNKVEPKDSMNNHNNNSAENYHGPKTKTKAPNKIPTNNNR